MNLIGVHGLIERMQGLGLSSSSGVDKLGLVSPLFEIYLFKDRPHLLPITVDPYLERLVVDHCAYIH